MGFQRSISIFAAVFAVLLAGCNSDKTTALVDNGDNGGDGGDSTSCVGDSSAVVDTMVIADFSLADVNASSSTFGDTVSPRAYLQKLSAWYFGHST